MHPIGFHPQREVQIVRRHPLEEVRTILGGGSVRVAADGLEGLEVLVVEMLAALEHQVLEEMGEAAATAALVGRADQVADLGGHHRQPVVFAQEHGEAVVELVLLDG